MKKFTKKSNPKKPDAEPAASEPAAMPNAKSRAKAHKAARDRASTDNASLDQADADKTSTPASADNSSTNRSSPSKTSTDTELKPASKFCWADEYDESPPSPSPAVADDADDEDDADQEAEADVVGDTNQQVEADAVEDTDQEAEAAVVDDWKQQKTQLLTYCKTPDLYIRGRMSKDGSQTLFYAVNSSYVRGISPRFESAVAFAKPQRISTGNTRLYLDLVDSEDSTHEGLDFIFQTAHQKYYEISNKLATDALYNIARTVKYYDCPHLVVPWVNSWMDRLDFDVRTATDGGDPHLDDKALYIAWVFGMARCVSITLPRAAHKATLSEDGVLLDRSGEPWKKRGLPEDIIDLMKKMRHDALIKISDAIDKPMRELTEGGKTAKKYCRSREPDSEMSQSCWQQQLGAIVSGLSGQKLMPYPQPNEYKGRVADLAEKVQSVKVSRLRIPGTKSQNDPHADCGIDHESAVKKAREAVLVFPRRTIDQLQTHAENCGAFDKNLFKDVRVEGLREGEEVGKPRKPEWSENPQFVRQRSSEFVFDKEEGLEDENKEVRKKAFEDVGKMAKKAAPRRRGG